MYGILTATLRILRSFQVDIEMPEDLDNEMECRKRVVNRQKQLALHFHELMTRGQSFEEVNVDRQEFYKTVVDIADGVRFFLLHDFYNRDIFFKFRSRCKIAIEPSTNSPSQYVDDDGTGVRTVGKDLCKYIDPERMLITKAWRWPLVLLSFDETDVLTDNPEEGEWTLFSELRRILQRLDSDDQAIFSLFLSTAGNFWIHSPNIKSDPSRRVVTEYLRPLCPITEISFDCLARPAGEGMVTLNQVVQISWIAHLGRPLYDFCSLPLKAVLM